MDPAAPNAENGQSDQARAGLSMTGQRDALERYRAVGPNATSMDALAALQDHVLDVGRRLDWCGHSKHDALNAPWLERLAGESRLVRLAATQAIMRAPLNLRGLLGVPRTRNPKGVALFARALLARFRVLGEETAASEAKALIDWLLQHSNAEFDGLSWGYPYPWQDVGFFAPRGFPNRIVTANVTDALLDAWETLGHEPYLDAAGEAARFLLESPRTLFETENARCVSYVPSASVSWIVMDVSALSGAAVARYASLRGDQAMVAESGRLVRYVAMKQTKEGAWYYTDPPDDSHITHDNYHTGIILDAILAYGKATGSREFVETYGRGLAFYRQRLFEADGAPRFMSDRRYPYDIHGAAQGILTFSRAHQHLRSGTQREAQGDVEVHGAIDMADSVLRWTIANLFDPDTGWFDYQKTRFFRKRIRLLRWCQAWMAHALGVYMESTSPEGHAATDFSER